MSYKNEIERVRQELVNIFISELRLVKDLIPLCNNKEELINKIKSNNLSQAYYYIKDETFENIIPKLNLLLVESEDNTHE